MYWPNIVGYVRLLFLLLGYILTFSPGLLLTFSGPEVALVCFLLNLVLDNIDGLVARHFNQVGELHTQEDVRSNAGERDC